MESKPKSVQDKKLLEKHLVLYRLSAIGDVAMLVPIVVGLYEQYPEISITVITSPFCKALFKDIRNVSILPLDKNKYKGILGLVSFFKIFLDTIPNKDQTTFVDMHAVLRSHFMRVLCRRYGISSVVFNKGTRQKRQALRNPSKSRSSYLPSTHQRYANILSKLGYPIDLEALHLSCPKVLDLHVIHYLDKLKFGKDKVYCIGIAPFSKHKGKDYPIASLEVLLEALSVHINFRILLFGGGEQQNSIFQQMTENWVQVYNVCGQFSFKQELDLISQLDTMISVDSANAHIAAMYNVPVLSLWGVTHPCMGFAPFRQSDLNHFIPDLNQYPQIPTAIFGDSYPLGYDKAITTIPVDKIISRLHELLSVKSDN